MGTKKKSPLELRQEAREALPGHLKVLLPLTYLGISFGLAFIAVRAAMTLRLTLRPDLQAILPPSNAPVTIEFIIALLASFFAGACFAIILVNALLWLVPTVRRVLNDNSRGIPGASFAQSMRTGLKAILFVALPCLLLLAIVALSPWS